MPNASITNYLGGWFSVVDYGADPAGFLNSTPGFQAALVAAGASGGYVIVPRGTYTMSSAVSFTGCTNVTLWLGNGVTLSGAGATITASGTGNAVQDGRSGSVPVLTSGTNTFTAVQTFSAGTLSTSGGFSAGVQITGGSLDMTQQSAPSAPAAGITRIYVKTSDGLPYLIQSGGVETAIGSTSFATSLMLMGG